MKYLTLILALTLPIGVWAATEGTSVDKKPLDELANVGYGIAYNLLQDDFTKNSISYRGYLKVCESRDFTENESMGQYVFMLWLNIPPYIKDAGFEPSEFTDAQEKVIGTIAQAALDGNYIRMITDPHQVLHRHNQSPEDAKIEYCEKWLARIDRKNEEIAEERRAKKEKAMADYQRYLETQEDSKEANQQLQEVELLLFGGVQCTKITIRKLAIVSGDPGCTEYPDP